MVFGVFDFLQKTNERIRLYYYDTSSRLVFVRFLEEVKDTKKPFQNYLTFTWPSHGLLNKEVHGLAYLFHKGIQNLRLAWSTVFVTVLISFICG